GRVSGNHSVANSCSSRGRKLKRRKLLKYLGKLRCVITEGAKHTRVFNPTKRSWSTVPRHPEIDSFLVREILQTTWNSKSAREIAVELLAKNDVIAAGFSRVFIDSGRYLRQEVIVIDCEDPQKNEVLRYKTRLSRVGFAKLWEIIDRIGFKNFKEFYSPETSASTDRASYCAMVRLAGQAREIAIKDL